VNLDAHADDAAAEATQRKPNLLIREEKRFPHSLAFSSLFPRAPAPKFTRLIAPSSFAGVESVFCNLDLPQSQPISTFE